MLLLRKNKKLQLIAIILSNKKIINILTFFAIILIISLIWYTRDKLKNPKFSNYSSMLLNELKNNNVNLNSNDLFENQDDSSKKSDENSNKTNLLSELTDEDLRPQKIDNDDKLNDFFKKNENEITKKNSLNLNGDFLKQKIKTILEENNEKTTDQNLKTESIESKTEQIQHQIKSDILKLADMISDSNNTYSSEEILNLQQQIIKNKAKINDEPTSDIITEIKTDNNLFLESKNSTDSIKDKISDLNKKIIGKSDNFSNNKIKSDRNIENPAEKIIGEIDNKIYYNFVLPENATIWTKISLYLIKPILDSSIDRFFKAQGFFNKLDDKFYDRNKLKIKSSTKDLQSQTNGVQIKLICGDSARVKLIGKINDGFNTFLEESEDSIIEIGKLSRGKGLDIALIGSLVGEIKEIEIPSQLGIVSSWSSRVLSRGINKDIFYKVEILENLSEITKKYLPMTNIFERKGGFYKASNCGDLINVSFRIKDIKNNIIYDFMNSNTDFRLGGMSTPAAINLIAPEMMINHQRTAVVPWGMIVLSNRSGEAYDVSNSSILSKLKKIGNRNKLDLEDMVIIDLKINYIK